MMLAIFTIKLYINFNYIFIYSYICPLCCNIIIYLASIKNPNHPNYPIISYFLKINSLNNTNDLI